MPGAGHAPGWLPGTGGSAVHPTELLHCGEGAAVSPGSQYGQERSHNTPTHPTPRRALQGWMSHSCHCLGSAGFSSQAVPLMGRGWREHIAGSGRSSWGL